MAILNQKRILNLIPKTSAPVTIHVSQGDVGTEIEFTLVKTSRPNSRLVFTLITSAKSRLHFGMLDGIDKKTIKITYCFLVNSKIILYFCTLFICRNDK